LYLNAIEDCFNFRHHFLEDLKTIKSLKEFFWSTREFIRFNKYRMSKNRPLVKDPIAIFSAEWLATRFNMDVVVLIRHPAAFAGSLKKVNWSHPFDHFLKQPLLIQDHLHEYRSEIEKFSKTEKDIVDQAILLWNLIHHMILKYKKNNPNWIFVKHEDLSRDSLDGFRSLFNRLGLNFTKNIEDKIAEFSLLTRTEKHIRKRRSKILKLKKRLIGDHSENRMRNSKKNIFSWKKRLTKDEIEKIKKKTQIISNNFYTEEDWTN
jgi:hypothetical protein